MRKKILTKLLLGISATAMICCSAFFLCNTQENKINEIAFASDAVSDNNAAWRIEYNSSWDTIPNNSLEGTLKFVDSYNNVFKNQRIYKEEQTIFVKTIWPDDNNGIFNSLSLPKTAIINLPRNGVISKTISLKIKIY